MPYRDEYGRFRKKTAEDAQREYEAMPPYLRNLHDAMAHAGRHQMQMILDGRADLDFSEGSQFRVRPDEQFEFRSLVMNRTNAGHQDAMNQRYSKVAHAIVASVDEIGLRTKKRSWWRRALSWLRIAP